MKPAIGGPSPEPSPPAARATPWNAPRRCVGARSDTNAGTIGISTISPNVTRMIVTARPGAAMAEDKGATMASPAMYSPSDTAIRRGLDRFSPAFETRIWKTTISRPLSPNSSPHIGVARPSGPAA
jgi:hypothetical protein